MGHESVSGNGQAAQSLVLAPHTAASQEARDFVAETLSAWRLDGWEEPAALIASELVSNAVRHAGTELTVRLLKTSSELRIEVSDGAADWGERADAAGVTVGGLGLVIVDRLAETWGVRKDESGKSVWARLALDPSRQPA